MISEKEALILKYIRENSRVSLAKISKETGIPVSTLFDVLKRLESSFILKHVSLLDFKKLGYHIRINFVIACKKRDELKQYLIKNKSVNTVSKLANWYDFYVECVFKDLDELTKFKEKLEEYDIRNLEETFVIDELKREEFTLADRKDSA